MILSPRFFSLLFVMFGCAGEGSKNQLREKENTIKKDSYGDVGKAESNRESDPDFRQVVIDYIHERLESEDDENNLKIVNGGEPDTDIQQSTVFVNLGGGTCTATLIADSFALSASHCFQGNRGASIGFGNSINSRTFRPVEQTYQDRERGDFTLLKFTGGIPQDFKPALLPSRDFALRQNQEVIIAGFGQSTRRGGAGQLLQGESVIRGIQGKWIDLNSASKNFSLCYGDSGGPTYVRSDAGLVVIGVTSSGDDCFGNDIVGNVQHHLSFIEQQGGSELANELAGNPTPQIPETTPADSMGERSERQPDPTEPPGNHTELHHQKNKRRVHHHSFAAKFRH